MNATVKSFFKRNLLTLILLVGSIILYCLIPSQIAENMVSKAAISPRFFPTFSTVGVMICTALLLIFDIINTVKTAKSGEAPKEEAKGEEISIGRVLIVILLMFAWYFLMPRIGFIISTILVMCVMCYLLGCRNKIVNIVFPVVFTLALYFAFVELLHVSLPEILF